MDRGEGASGDGADRDMRGACSPREKKIRRRDADGSDRDGRAPQEFGGQEEP